jgi:hypothetical protein
MSICDSKCNTLSEDDHIANPFFAVRLLGKLECMFIYSNMLSVTVADRTVYFFEDKFNGS